MKACQKWFEEESQIEAAKIDGPVARILIFSVKEDKNEYVLIQSLMVCTICFDIKGFLFDKAMRSLKLNYLTGSSITTNNKG